LIETINVMAWLTSTEALAALGTKPQSLYASVSRGRVRTRPDPADPRRRLYDRDDVLRLVARAAGRRRTEAVAAESLRWGDPVLPTAISTVAAGRLFYCGQDAVALAGTATLEDVAALLWQVDRVAFNSGRLTATPSRKIALQLLAERAADDRLTSAETPAERRVEAIGIVSDLADAFGATADELPLHRRLAAGWRRPEAAHLIRRALVLLAEHELNASTFAVRVAASTGGPLAAAVLAGLATLVGPAHGGAADAIADLARQPAAARGPDRPLPGFGHRLYPGGDPRAKALLADLALPPAYASLLATGQTTTGEAPNIDFALAALSISFGLPEDAPFMLFALARSVGWVAHALEQIESGMPIRPRARYVGPAPASAG